MNKYFALWAKRFFMRPDSLKMVKTLNMFEDWAKCFIKNKFVNRIHIIEWII